MLSTQDLLKSNKKYLELVIFKIKPIEIFSLDYKVLISTQASILELFRKILPETEKKSSYF